MKRLLLLPILFFAATVWALNPTVQNDSISNIDAPMPGQLIATFHSEVYLLGADSIEVFVSDNGNVVSDTFKIAVSGYTPVSVVFETTLGSHSVRMRAMYRDTANGIFLQDAGTSTPVNFTLQPPEVTSVTTVSATTNSLTVRAEVDGGFFEANAQMCIRESGTSTFSGCQSKATINGATNATFTGLSDSTEYEIRLRPSNLLGSGTQTVTQHWTRNVFSAVLIGSVDPGYGTQDEISTNTWYNLGGSSAGLTVEVFSDVSLATLEKASQVFQISGTDNKIINFINLDPATTYWVLFEATLLNGTVISDVRMITTDHVNLPTGQLISYSFTESEAMVTVDIDPQGLYPGSETTIWAEWVPLNSSVTKLSQQISVTNQQSINLTIFNLLGDQPGELKVYAENAAGTLTVATVSGRTDFPQRQNIILSSLTIDNDGVVTAVVEADGNGLESELSIDFFRNGDRVSSFDTILGSSGSNVVVQFQANECDTISVDAYLYTTLFGDEIAENNRAKVYAFCPKDVVNSISETTKKRYTGMADVYTLMGQYIGEVKIINGNRERTNFNIAPGAYIYKTSVEQYGEKFYINR